MDYLFRGIAPPSLPPVPNVELRQSNSQKGEQMLSEEVRKLPLKSRISYPSVRPSSEGCVL